MSLEDLWKWHQGPPWVRDQPGKFFLVTKFYDTFGKWGQNIGLVRRSWNPGSATKQLKF